ncbi:MAG: hypothetical protein CMQ40_03920 [Gammaproteobacteria bacterium]|nr:hypothetical protein [Gammaproteobacteria bacterium]
MSSEALIRAFNRAINFLGGGWIAVILGLVIVAFVVWFIFRSGRQLRLRIPFLPAGIGTINIGRDQVAGLASRFSSSSRRPKKIGKSRAVREAFANVDALSAAGEKRYELPVFLLLSHDESASALVSDIGEDTLQRLSLKDTSGDEEGYCLVMEDGCVVYHDYPDDVVSELLVQRPERPMDGIILSVSAKDLMSPDRQERDKLLEWLYQEFRRVQQKVDFVLPVYLVVSDMQSLQGFHEFWAMDDNRRFQDDILGWSSPYAPDVQFKIDWIDEAFNHVLTQIRAQQLALSARDNAGHDGAFLGLGPAMENLREPVNTLANDLLSPGVLAHPLMFRGLYFTGQIQANGRSRFLTGLFQRKVFPESKLGFPRRERMLSSSARLRGFQLASLAIGAGLVAWFFNDFHTMYEQHQELDVAIDRVNNVVGNREGFDAIQPLLSSMAEMNASLEYCCGAVPWSAWLNENILLEDYFKREFFSKNIFPVMECRGRQILQEKVRPQLFDTAGAYQGEKFEVWLKEVSNDINQYFRLHELMVEKSNSGAQSATAKEFAELVDYLFQKELPQTFYNDADLYLNAIANNEFRLVPAGENDCPNAVSKAEDLWEQLIGASREESKAVRQRVAAPVLFLSELRRLESLSIDQASISASGLAAYDRWHDFMWENWLGGSGSNFCHTVSSELSSVASQLDEMGEITFDRGRDIENFERNCETNIAQQLNADNENLQGELYSRVFFEDRLSPKVGERIGRFFDLLDQVAGLSFSGQQWSSEKTNQINFFWSVDRLNQALTYAEEYSGFATTNFNSLYLPDQSGDRDDGYLAQAVALARLQKAMVSVIETAKIPQARRQSISLTTVDKREAELASRVSNFKKAINPLLAIISFYEQTGFLGAKRRLLQESQESAFNLLKQVDRLYEANRVYQPRQKANWKAHRYAEALFGLHNENQIEDYLAAQSERTRIIGRDYAQPLVLFLTNTGGAFSGHALLSRWHRTLVEINKQQNKDPSSDVDILEQFYLGDFASLNLSNCAELTKSFSVPESNSVFANRTAELVNRSISHCQSFQAARIEKEYDAISSAFLELLAPYYPFNSHPKAKSLSPANLKQFKTVYAGKSDGLAERMRVLAWKQTQYEEAEQFINDLDDALILFDQIVGSVVGQDSPGVELEMAFNVILDEALGKEYLDHLSGWRLQVGDYGGEYPGELKTIYWRPDQLTKLTLQWAAGSPYRLLSPVGNMPRQTLEYKSGGYWSLLRFIQDYRSSFYDEKALNEESVLLGFDAKILNPVSGGVEKLDALLRLTLYGIDPETKQRVALKVPFLFPATPPEVKKG